MNIGFDAKRLFHNKTGLGNYSRTLVNNLISHQPENNYFLYTPHVSENQHTNRISDQKNVFVRTANGHHEIHWRSFGIKKLISNDDIDIYHGLSHELPRNNDKLKCKKIVTIHDLIFKKYPSFFSLADRTIYEIKCKHAIKTADTIIAISENTKKDIIKYYDANEQKIEVAYQSCNPIFYHTPKKQRLKLPIAYNLCIGTFEHRKNQLNILKAYAQLPTALQIPLIFIGNGKKYLKSVFTMIGTLGLSDVVMIMNNVKTEDLPEIYRRANMLLYPSLYEGFGLPVVEAMLSGIPVLTSNTSSLPEAGGPDSYYVNPLSVEEIKHGIEILSTDKKLRATMVDRSKKYAHANFSTAVTTKKIIDIYKT